MANNDLFALFRQPAFEFFGNVDRAVLTARAADGDCQIALALGAKTRQQRLQKACQVAEIGCEIRVAIDEFTDRGVLPGQGPQLIFIVRIFEKPRIENKSASCGNPLR